MTQDNNPIVHYLQQKTPVQMFQQYCLSYISNPKGCPKQYFASEFKKFKQIEKKQQMLQILQKKFQESLNSDRKNSCYYLQMINQLVLNGQYKPTNFVDKFIKTLQILHQEKNKSMIECLNLQRKLLTIVLSAGDLQKIRVQIYNRLHIDLEQQLSAISKQYITTKLKNMNLDQQQIARIMKFEPLPSGSPRRKVKKPILTQLQQEQLQNQKGRKRVKRTKEDIEAVENQQKIEQIEKITKNLTQGNKLAKMQKPKVKITNNLANEKQKNVSSQKQIIQKIMNQRQLKNYAEQNQHNSYYPQCSEQLKQQSGLYQHDCSKPIYYKLKDSPIQISQKPSNQLHKIKKQIVFDLEEDEQLQLNCFKQQSGNSGNSAKKQQQQKQQKGQNPIKKSETNIKLNQLNKKQQLKNSQILNKYKKSINPSSKNKNVIINLQGNDDQCKIIDNQISKKKKFLINFKNNLLEKREQEKKRRKQIFKKLIIPIIKPKTQNIQKFQNYLQGLKNNRNTKIQKKNVLTINKMCICCKQLFQVQNLQFSIIYKNAMLVKQEIENKVTQDKKPLTCQIKLNGESVILNLQKNSKSYVQKLIHGTCCVKLWKQFN